MPDLEDPTAPASLSPIVTGLGCRSQLTVPLLRGGQPIGTLALQRRGPGPFSAAQIELVETFADQAVIAIENARLFHEVQARTAERSSALEQQTATSEVLQVISRSTSNLQSVFDAIIATAARLCQADGAVIFKAFGDCYEFAAFNNVTPELAEHFAKGLRSHADRGSATGRAMVEGRTIHIPDVLADPEFTRLDTQRAGNFRTVLAVPLLRESTPIGVIFLYRFAVRPFRDRQIELVTSFADQAVIAIENVRLFDEVQARTAELMEALQQQTATSEVLQVINASPRKLTPVFDAMLAKAAQLCNAELGILWTYDNGTFVIAAERGTPAPSTIFGTEPVRPGPTTGLARIAREKRVVHIPISGRTRPIELASRSGSPPSIGLRCGAGSACLCSKRATCSERSRSIAPNSGRSRISKSRCSRASPTKR